MKILHTVEFYSPSVGGAQEVTKHISEQLAKRGHQVTVATTKLDGRRALTLNGVHIEEFNISGDAIHGYQGETKRYQQFLLENRFDLMMNYAAQQWATDLVFPLLNRISYRKVLSPCGFSGLFTPAYEKYFEKMPDVMRQYDHLIFHSETYRDIQFARQHGLSRFTVIPNGASEEEFRTLDGNFRQRHRIPEGVPMLLTVGSHTGQKGHRLAIEAFCRARIGAAVFVVIGNTIGGGGCLRDCQRLAWWSRLVSLGQKEVILLNPLRKDVVAAYHAADLFVFGSNIECAPLVLFEAMASKTPFVTTACGNAEEIVELGQGGVVVPTTWNRDGTVTASSKTMAGVIEELIGSPVERRRLAEAGYKAWVDRFTWEKITSEYEQIFQKVSAVA